MSGRRDLQPKGFTFIELLMTLAILGTLALVVIPMAELTVQRQKERQLRSALAEIRGAIDAYKRAVDQGRIKSGAGESGYPKSLEVLVEGVEDMKSTDRNMMYFLRRLPRDPMHPDATFSPAATWKKRSYASPPDDPQEGDDVFDVFSTSDQLGLNGVAYREW